MASSSFDPTRNSRPNCIRHLKGKCNGSLCKYLHNYKYCKDFQNLGHCDLLHCKFMHVSKQDMVAYVGSGALSAIIIREANRTKQVGLWCKDHLYKVCNRGLNCKYRHGEVGPVNDLCCQICVQPIREQQLSSFSKCNHILCRTCSERLPSELDGTTSCPFCRKKGLTFEMM